jgi:triphosphatase
MAKQQKTKHDSTITVPPTAGLVEQVATDRQSADEQPAPGAEQQSPVAEPQQDQPLPKDEPVVAKEAPVGAVKAEKVRLRGRMTLEDAFQAIGLNCVQQIEANVPGVLKQHIESLHQMRVGLRRLRALLAMFEELAAPPVPLHASVEWLSGELGPARDWDVLADSTLKQVPGFDSGALRQAAHDRATGHHAQILHVLRDPRYAELMTQLNDWLLERRWRPEGGLPKDSPLLERAEKSALPLLRTAEKRLAKRIDGLEDTDAPGRHRVRIAAKKARYAAEFFRDLLPARRVKRYIGHLEKLQDRLGALNDLSVADHLLEELKGGSSQVAKQAAYVRGYIAASSEAGAQGLSKVLADVAKRRITR